MKRIRQIIASVAGASVLLAALSAAAAEKKLVVG